MWIILFHVDEINRESDPLTYSDGDHLFNDIKSEIRHNQMQMKEYLMAKFNSSYVNETFSRQ